MATRDELVLAAVSAGPDPICETCLAEAAGLKRQQDVNPTTRGYAALGRLGRGRATCRVCGRVKKAVWAEPTADYEILEEQAAARPWHWEGNVVAVVKQWLEERGATVLSVADTASRERGADILARLPGGEVLRVEAKGHPGPEKNATQMARHYFSGLLTEAVILRGRDPARRLALALPRLAPYPRRAMEVRWLLRHMALVVLWVDEDGKVELQPPGVGSGWWSVLGG